MKTFESVRTLTKCDWVHMNNFESDWTSPECNRLWMNAFEWVKTPPIYDSVQVNAFKWELIALTIHKKHFWLLFMLANFYIYVHHCKVSLWFHMDKTWHFWSSVFIMGIWLLWIFTSQWWKTIFCSLPTTLQCTDLILIACSPLVENVIFFHDRASLIFSRWHLTWSQHSQTTMRWVYGMTYHYVPHYHNTSSYSQ